MSGGTAYVPAHRSLWRPLLVGGPAPILVPLSNGNGVARRPRLAVVVAIAVLAPACRDRGGSEGDEGASGPPAAPQAEASSSLGNAAPQGATDVTFLVTSDTHFGYGVPAEPERRPVDDLQGIEVTLKRQVDAMNAIGGSPWPAPLGGTIAEPKLALVTGDLTENGRPREWERFVQFFGLRGEGLLAYPVYETLGNHDKHDGLFVKQRITERHGGDPYAFDVGAVHFVSLGEAPDEEDSAWLAEDLAKVGKQRAVVLYFHFPLGDPHLSNTWFADERYRVELREAISGYRILGIFHGHYHASGRYEWEGYDVYNVGSAKHGWYSFAVVHVDARRFTVASYNYDERRFWWWHQKPLDGQGEERSFMEPDRALVRRLGREAELGR